MEGIVRFILGLLGSLPLILFVVIIYFINPLMGIILTILYIAVAVITAIVKILGDKIKHK